jgi:hypothetical protein
MIRCYEMHSVRIWRMLCSCGQPAVTSPGVLMCFDVLQLHMCVPATAEAVCVAVAEGRWNDVPQIDVASVLQA